MLSTPALSALVLIVLLAIAVLAHAALKGGRLLGDFQARAPGDRAPRLTAVRTGDQEPQA